MAYRDNFHLVPERMQGGVVRYIEHGIRPGHFMTHLLANDFMAALGHADDINQANVVNWARFIYMHMPSSSHGSAHKVEQWIARGGLAGLASPKKEEDANV